MQKIILLEIRRQIAHLCFGVLLTVFVFLDYVDSWFLGAFVLTFLAFILYWKSTHGQTCRIKKILAFFERDEHIERFPGRGVFFFLLGAFCAVAFFPKEIALASILILSVGDSVSHIYGRFLGKIKIPFCPEKNVEGHILGILLAAGAATIFVPFFPALLAATVAMIFEIPRLSIGSFPLDDNVLIPVAAAITLSIWNMMSPFLHLPTLW